MNTNELTEETPRTNPAAHTSSLREKAFVLAFLSLVSGAFAIAVGFACYLFFGRTSAGTWYNPYWMGFFFICGFLAAAFFVFRHDIRTKPENLFLVIVLSVTCFSSLALDVNRTSWDDGIHFRHVLEWSTPGHEIALSVSEAELAGLSRPPDYRYSELAELYGFSAGLDKKDAITSGVIVRDSIRSLYQRVGHLPASLVYTVLSMLSIPFSLKYVLARLANALLYSLVTYFGMRQLRSGKMLFGVIALLPTAVFLASNYSYDYWVNAFMLFGGACLVRELQTPDDPVTPKRAALLLGSFVLAFGPKAIYFPLILLCLLIPKAKFATTSASKLFRASVISISLLVAISFIVPYLFVNGPGTGDMRGGSAVNATEQVNFILSNPFEYAKILFSFLATDYYSFFGSKDFITHHAYLGHSSWILWILALGLLGLTALTDKSESDKAVCTGKARALTLSLNLVTVTLITTALYIEINAVGSKVIDYVQPRYLIPLLFCTLVFLGSHRLAWPRRLDSSRKTAYNALVLGIMAAILLIGLWQVYIGRLY
ncbi:MAG: DUF2142 domain-containing protein [Eggerthellaceae bacterium]|nr:DUF2142 domain-containing protein [Eggerthellaceae bacterium]